MHSRESRDHLHCSGLGRESAGCLYSWGAYFHMGAYIREVLVRTEMCAYIHGVPVVIQGAYYPLWYSHKWIMQV